MSNDIDITRHGGDTGDEQEIVSRPPQRYVVCDRCLAQIEAGKASETTDPDTETLRVQVGQLRSSLEATLRMRRFAEGEYRKARELMWNLAREFVPQALDDLRKADHTVDGWDMEKLARWICEAGKTRLLRLERMSRADLDEKLAAALEENKALSARLGVLQEAKARLERVEAENAELRERLDTRDRELRDLRVHRESLRKNLDEASGEIKSLRRRLREANDEIAALTEDLDAALSARSKPTKPTTRPQAPREQPPAKEPATAESPAEAPPPALPGDDEWMSRWRKSRSFGLDTDVLLVMGTYGFCLRESIERALIRRGSVSGSSRGSVSRALRRLGKEMGLIGRTKPRGEVSGSSPHLYYLTDKGRQAFKMIFEEEPVESEYDRLLARHKSPEHVLLNLMARDVFLDRGATSVDLYPLPIRLGDGGLFDPDLVVTLEGESLYVECERGGPKVLKDRVRKWSNYSVVTSNFYVVVPNNRAQDQLVAELDGWAIQHKPERILLRICNLSRVKDEDASLWTVERRIGSWK